MKDDDTEVQRRSLLQMAAGAALTSAGAANAATPAATAAATAATPAPDAAKGAATPRVLPPTGKAGDFDFLIGQWKINNRRLKTPGSNDWDVFEGEATCWSILGGVASIEELRIPARNFSGMGLRLLDVERRVWADFWVNSRSGVLVPPPTEGVFENGAGRFVSEDTEGSPPMQVLGLWDGITANACRWTQSLSYDGGKTWQGQWFMTWTRA